MSTEQSQDSDASIHQRFVAAFTPEAAEESAPAAETETSPLEAAEYDADATDETTEQPEAAPDVVDVEDDDGTPHKVPAKLKDAFLRRADYTRKTQEAATLAETAQDRLQYVEAREQFTEAFTQKAAEVQALKLQLKQFDGVDIGALYTSDPGTALRLRDQRDDLRRQVMEGEQILSQGKAHLDQIVKQHSEKQWGLAVQGAKQRIGTFTPGEDAAMLKQVAELGFTEREIKGRFADPRILHAIYKAAKWDTLQANKGKAVATAQTAPPVLKPGASKGPGVAAEQQYRDARAQLKKSGDVRDAARLFLMKSRG